MPPSPALRCSPGRELRADSHERGRSLESGLPFREKDDDLALFNEMQSRETENFLLQSSDNLEDPFSTKLRHFSDIKLGISVPGRGESSELLNADGDKNDYDWLLTPPDTPLFPSLDDDEPPPINVATRGRPQSKPISISRSSTMEKSHRSSRGSASPNRLSPSPRSGNNMPQTRGRPSSVPNSSPTQSLRHATPTRRPSTPPNKSLTPTPRSSTPIPRRLSTGSNGPVVSSGIRGTSPVKTSRGNSASPKIRAWQTNIPGFSSEAPPNLRTSLADRPASYVRGSSPASRNGKDSTGRFSRQSISPTASRRSSSSFYSNDRDQFSARSKGSVASSGDDDTDSIQSIPVGSLDRMGSRRSGSFSNNRTPAFSKKSVKMMSPNSAPKRSFDSALRQMDRKSPQNMFRPLLSSVPSTTFYVGKANSARHSLVSRNSSVTTSSNASSDLCTSFALDTEGSDHNHDDAASEAEKTPYPDIHDEVFAFDKGDILNANIGHDINDEAVDIHHNEFRDSKLDFDPTISEDSVYQEGIDTATVESSETSYVKVDIMETGSFDNTAICSRCGCHYEASDQAEKDARLCPECSGKNTQLTVITNEAVLAVAEDSSMFSTNESAEIKPVAETDELLVTHVLHQDTGVGDLNFSLGEQYAEESHTSCSELNEDQSRQIPLPSSSSVEGGSQIPTNLLDMEKPGVDYRKPNVNVGGQQLHHYSPNLKMDLSEGTGISVLLKRSSSIKGPVVQGRTFTATTISYDDISLARGSVSSIRSSTGHGSYSASSSIDFSPVKKMDFSVQRQLSGRKLDVDCGYEIRIKHQRTGSSFSGTSNHSHHGIGLATQETECGKTDCGILAEIPIISQVQISENTVTDVIDASSMGSIVEENKFEYYDSGRANDACNSELLSQSVGFESDGDCISCENVEDHSNIVRSLSNTETSVMAPGSLDEENQVQSPNVDGLDALPATNISSITESEIEKENSCVGEDDPSQVSKSTMDDSQESSVPNSNNVSFPEFNTSEYSHGIEESTVTVECQDGGNTRNLTLEEATDTILFCSSIIHDLAYQAATIAMEKESTEPLEGSKPTVALLGTPNTGSRKGLRSRTVGKRTLKSQKVRQRKVETDVKSPLSKTENDENVDESFKHNAGLPDKVDSTKPPKLESKCNCTVM
ncbi:flocculation protein FLO11 [Senna tora]|uniref:Flocculation protein FLO11 n=1 Tax=Senna tora TaxID=362788 RepID=A0A834TB82_9FABA|nr:flocculation protein FLO11 [Senna tora]